MTDRDHAPPCLLDPHVGAGDDQQVRKVRPVLFAVVFLLRGLVVMIASAGQVGGAEPPRVLMVFSNDRLLPANQRYDEGIRRALDPQGDQSSVTFYGEFLDAIRLGGEAREEAMVEYLRKRYHDGPPNVLVALGPQALSFFLARRDSLFPGTPLVFGGVSQARLEQVRGVPGVAGLPMELTVAPAVEALIAMRPQTREVLLVHGASDFDRSWRDNALLQCAPFADRVTVTDFPELPLEELKSRLGELAPETAVVYLTYFQGATGETYTPARVAVELAAAAAVPVMGPYDTYIGSGVLGVSVSPFDEEGVTLGNLIRRVLDGETPESIGILPPNPPRLILDDRQVRRWGITSVPQEAELRFHTPSLWEEHRGFLIGAAAVFAVQAALIAGLLAQRARRQRSEREALELRHELTHASRVTMLGTLASSLAHELNQPLGAILRNAEAAELFLQSDAPDLNELRAIVTDIRKDDQRAGGVIDRLRALLKRREFEPRAVSLNELVDEVVTLTRADSVTRQVGIQVELPRDLPWVRGDRIHLQQVLLNLLINGMDALASKPDGERALTLRARWEGNGVVEVAVSDNGPGIPAAKMGRLFEPFFTTKSQGMGLGLPISRTIIEAHGGKLWAENNADCGATFRFTLPVAEGDCA